MLILRYPVVLSMVRKTNLGPEIRNDVNLLYI